MAGAPEGGRVSPGSVRLEDMKVAQTRGGSLKCDTGLEKAEEPLPDVFVLPSPEGGVPPVDQYHWMRETPPLPGGRGCPHRDPLKLGLSLTASAFFFPFLVWGGFVFLPFDAPLMDSTPLRLVYTLRCSVFATMPIILGWLVLGVTRLKSSAIQPLFDLRPSAPQEISVHRHFVSDSASLFLIYFLQLAVMAMYLSQEQLKLVSLLAIIFVLGRLVYWVSTAFGSSIRGFGFGLTFLPSLVMTAANIYFIFSVDAAGSIFRLTPAQLAPPPGKQRFWG